MLKNLHSYLTSVKLFQQLTFDLQKNGY